MDFGILVDVAIGVLAVLVLFSIATSAVNEFIADWVFRLRGKALAQGVEKLLARELEAAGVDETTLTARTLRDEFFGDADIKVLMTGERLPSAIEGRRYALTVLKLLGKRAELKAALDSRIAQARLEAEETVRVVAEAAEADDVGNKIAEKLGRGAAIVTRLGDESIRVIDAAVARLEGEFDEVMDRVSGWYLRRTKIALFVIGFLLAIGSNIDVLRYTDRMLTAGDLRARIDNVARLIESDELEARVVRIAKGAGTDAATGGDAEQAAGKLEGSENAPIPVAAGAGSIAGRALFGPAQLDPVDRELGFIINQFDAMEVKVGWDCLPASTVAYPVPWSERYCDPGETIAMPSPSQVIGWILIAFGVTFGAQMWFDLVKRLVRLRTSGITGGVATRTGF